MTKPPVSVQGVGSKLQVEQPPFVEGLFILMRLQNSRHLYPPTLQGIPVVSIVYHPTSQISNLIQLLPSYHMYFRPLNNQRVFNKHLLIPSILLAKPISHQWPGSWC